MKIKLVLCWLTVALLVAGCATGKNREVKKVVTIGETYINPKKLILPEQKTGVMPFHVWKAKSSRYTKKDLVPTMAVNDYLEAIATTGCLPLRVREGFLFKESNQWYLVEWPPEVVYQPFGMFGKLGNSVYYVVNMKMVR